MEKLPEIFKEPVLIFQSPSVAAWPFRRIFIPAL